MRSIAHYLPTHMDMNQMLLLQTLITKSRRMAAYLNEEINILLELGMNREALPKAYARDIHLRRIVRYQEKLRSYATGK